MSEILLTEEVLESLSDEEILALQYDWRTWARPNQIMPSGDWHTWLILAGRGYGKTRTGAETLRIMVEEHGVMRPAIIAPTTADLRDVIVEGESGVMATSPPWNMPNYEPSKRRLTWPNGAVASLYSAEEPERLRGPQHDFLWGDEWAAWQYPQETMDMAMFGLRLGKNPRRVLTTTPKPIRPLRDLVKQQQNGDSGVVITRGSTYENLDNLAPTFRSQILQYDGTTLGRQEIYAEIIDPSEAGIIKRSWFKMWPRNKKIPRFDYVIQSYDTAFTEATHSDYTACLVMGFFEEDGRIKGMICDAWKDKMEYPTLRQKVMDDWQATYGETDPKTFAKPRRPDEILLEFKGSGISLAQDLGRARVPVRKYNPGRADKVQRAHSIAHLVMNGLVYIPESSRHKGQFVDWIEPFLEEICIFPADQDEHDDFVDAFTQLMSLVRDQEILLAPKLNLEEPEEMDYNSSRHRRSNPYAM